MSSASLPKHQYVWVDKSFIREGGTGFEPAVWFGIHSHPGRAWGCHVLLECGAVYRNLPPHALGFNDAPPAWGLGLSQLWDCYGRQFSVLQYDYLSTLTGKARIQGADFPIEYLFTVVPFGEGFSDAPDQSKEFMFLKTTAGRLTIQPTNKVLFEEKSFTTKVEWPKDLKRQSTTWSCET